MSVYHVYTKTAHVPTYVLYRCQKCRKIVAAKGTYDFSASYSDRGAWSSKRVKQREDDATLELEVSAGGTQSFLRKDLMEVTEDFRKIQCQCPRCGHFSLGKMGNIDVIDTRITLGLLAAALIFAVFMGIRSKSFQVFFGGVLLGLPAAGLCRLLCKSILEKVNSQQMKGVIRETLPLISANKTRLMNEAKNNPEYQNADFSAIQDQPDIL